MTSAENVITSNLTVYTGHHDLNFYRSCVNQGKKIALQIQTFDHYKHGEKFNGQQRKYVFAGVERSGHLQSIGAGHSSGAGISAFDYKWPNAPRFAEGHCLSELSSSGAKKEGISRLWAAIRNGTLTTLTTSDTSSPLAQMVIGQDEGVNIDWEDTDKRYPEGSSNELEGFRPGKNFKSKIDFYKTFPWVKSTEDLVMEIPDRGKSVGGLNEDSGVALAGNLSECSGDWLNKLKTITYQNCKGELSEKNVTDEFYRLLDQSSRELRTSFSHVISQKDKLGNICEDTYNKDFIIFNGTGDDTGRKSQASQMRGEHAGIRNVIHVDSENEPWMMSLIDSLSESNIQNNVRAITLSESLQTHSKGLTEFLESRGVITYGITANDKSEIVKNHPDRWVVIPNQSVHVIKSSSSIPFGDLKDPNSPPEVRISSYKYCVLPVADCITSYWIVKNKANVNARHKTGE